MHASDRTEAILDHAHSAVVSLDASGIVTYWNPSAERLFDIPAAEALGRPVAELIIPARLRAAHRTGMRRFVAGGEPKMLDRRVLISALRADGSEFPVEMTITALNEESGWSFTAFIADVSERVAHEHEREQLVAQLRDALHESEVRFETIVGALSEAVTIRSRDHRIIYANQAALEYLGFDSLAELQATSPDQIMAAYRVFTPDGREITMADVPSVRILNGQPADPLTIRMVHRETGIERWSILKAAPLRTQGGEVHTTIMLIADVTAEQRAARHSAFLAHASDVLASSLSYEETLRHVAELAVPDIADWCAVDLLSEAGGRQPVAIAHSDPGRLALAQELRLYEPAHLDLHEGLGLVFRTGTPVFYPEIPDDLLVRAAVDERHLELLREVGLRSGAVVPMRLGNRILGALTLVGTDSGRTINEADVVLAEELATRAAAAIENARLYSQRNEIAHTLQQSLLPQRLPDIPGYELASAYIPAVAGTEVGGDFYDAWPTRSGWMLTIGDVTGKGIVAAALTSLARHTLRSGSTFLNSPAELLAHLNSTLIAQSEFSVCTAICLHLNPLDDQVTIAAGGHPLPVRITTDGHAETVGRPGLLLGAFSDGKWQDINVKLDPGESLLLYTDGVTDTIGEHHARYGPDRLAERLRSVQSHTAAEMIASLTEDLERFQVGPHADDTAMLAIRRHLTATQPASGFTSASRRPRGVIPVND